MNFGLYTALVSTKGSCQYMNMQSLLGKKYAERYHFGIRSQVVTQFPRSVIAIKRLHGMFGVFGVKKLQEVYRINYFLSSKDSQITVINLFTIVVLISYSGI